MERYTLLYAFSLVGVLLYLWFKKRELFSCARNAKNVLWNIGGIMAFILFCNSVMHYVVWKSGFNTKFLLPPYTTYTYFLQFIGMRIWLPYVISFVVAWSVYNGIRIINKKFEERFFYVDEYVSAAIGFFLVGYPGVLYYGGSALILFLGATLVYGILEKHIHARASLQYIWLPLAACVILTEIIIGADIPWWNMLRL